MTKSKRRFFKALQILELMNQVADKHFFATAIRRFFIPITCLLLFLGTAPRIHSQYASALLTIDPVHGNYGGEINLLLPKVMVFYGLNESFTYIEKSTLHEFGDNLYTYSVKGQREIYGLKFNFFDITDPVYSEPGESLNIFLGVGTGKIETDMKITKYSFLENDFEKESLKKKVEFRVNTFLAGIFATGNRIGVEIRMRYETADIPIIDEETGDERDEEFLHYQLLAPELAIGMVF